MHGGHHFFTEFEDRKINFWKAYQEKLSYKKADGFIPVSNFVKEHTQKYLSLHNKPVTMINNFIDKKKFYLSRKKYLIPYRIVFAGTVCKKKVLKS